METKSISVPCHPLANFEIQKYYLNDPRFNGVYFRDNFSKTIKDEAYVINVDEYADVGTHWIALYCKNNEIAYFNSFEAENVPNELKKFIGHKNIKTNIFGEQSNNSIMCGYFCIEFIDFMFEGKILIDFTRFFSPYYFETNDSIILISKMNETNSTETIDGTNLTDQTKFRLSEIRKIEKYFNSEINQRKSCSK